MMSNAVQENAFEEDDVEQGTYWRRKKTLSRRMLWNKGRTGVSVVVVVIKTRMRVDIAFSRVYIPFFLDVCELI